MSLAFVFILPLGCGYIVLPALRLAAAMRENNPGWLVCRLLQREVTVLAIHTGILIATVTGATYAGSSGLLGAYIAGAMISWWDAEAPQPQLRQRPDPPPENEHDPGEAEGSGSTVPVPDSPGRVPPHDEVVVDANLASTSNAGASIFGKYYQPVLHRVFKPLFFVRHAHMPNSTDLHSLIHGRLP